MNPRVRRTGRNEPQQFRPGQKGLLDGMISSEQIVQCVWAVIGFAGLGGIFKLGEIAPETFLGYLAVLFACSIPALLWAKGAALGMPLYPCFCAVHFLAFGTPLLSHHPSVFTYSPQAHLDAALSVAAFIVAGTIPWLTLTRNRPILPFLCYRLRETGGEVLLLASLGANVLFGFSNMTGAVSFSGGVFSLVQGVSGGLGMLGVFVLSERLGSGKLKKEQRWIFLVLLVLNCLIQLTGLLLTNVIGIAVLAYAGYVLGSRRIPWIHLITFAVLMAFLHGGKTRMREENWENGETRRMRSVEQFVVFVEDWMTYSTEKWHEKLIEGEEEPSNLLQRSSLMHLMLMMREQTSHGQTFLYGSTYAVIPRLLVPRIIDPGKPWSHEGTYLLCIHFGLQEREDTYTTTIGFGLANEAYGNFGVLGCIGIGMVLGGFFGWVSKWSMGMPFLSFRSLFAVLVLGISFQTEFPASVAVTTLFQSTVALVAFSAVFMKKLPLEEKSLVQEIPRGKAGNRLL